MPMMPPKVQPLFVGDINFDPDVPTRPKLFEDPTGPLRIYKYPTPDMNVSAGVDTSEGKHLDDSAAVFLSHDDSSVVAVFQDDGIEPQQYGIKVYLMGLLYDAFLVVEANTVGQSVLAVLEHGLLQVPLAGPMRRKLEELANQQGGKFVAHMTRRAGDTLPAYKKLYTEQRIDMKSLEEKTSLGIRSVTGTKERLISEVAELFNQGMLKVYDLPLLQQMQGLVLEPKQVVTRRQGISQKKVYVQTFREPGARMAKDDLILALAFANHGAFMAPHVKEGLCPEPERADW